MVSKCSPPLLPLDRGLVDEILDDKLQLVLRKLLLTEEQLAQMEARAELCRGLLASEPLGPMTERGGFLPTTQPKSP